MALDSISNRQQEDVHILFGQKHTQPSTRFTSQAAAGKTVMVRTGVQSVVQGRDCLVGSNKLLSVKVLHTRW